MTMTRDEIERHVAALMADGLDSLRFDLVALVDRLVAAKAVPPFAPPAAWTAGRHGAGSVVRNRNGLFVARHDTDAEPGLDVAWLPLVVGLADFDVVWTDDRTLEIRCTLSDGKQVVRAHEFDVPIVRGAWDAGATYRPGDRVFRAGEWQARAVNMGVEPGNGTPESDAAWTKCGGRRQRALDLVLNQDGTLIEAGREIGSVRPLIAGLLANLMREQTNGGGHDDGR